MNNQHPPGTYFSSGLMAFAFLNGLCWGGLIVAGVMTWL